MKSLTQAPHGVNTSATSSSYREWDKVTWLPYNEGLVAQWCLHKPGITPDSFKRAGGRLGRKPDKTNIVALPVFGPLLTEQDPIGWVEWRRDGLDIIRKIFRQARERLGVDAKELVQSLRMPQFARIPMERDLEVSLSLNHRRPLVLEPPGPVSDAIINAVVGLYPPIQKVWEARGGHARPKKKGWFGFGRKSGNIKRQVAQ